MSHPTTDLDLSSYKKSPSRLEMWTKFVHEHDVRTMVEVGVFRGEFARDVLDSCPSIKTYYMVDPWRQLEDWNKPVNSRRHDDIYRQAMQHTEAHADRRQVLRGRTSEVVDQIGNGELDLAYVDGDHTLRGISIDLIQVWPKVRDGGFIGGDDFSGSLWQHAEDYEPSFVFPWAVYFAEAMRSPIWALPFRQFVIHKQPTGFRYVDLTGNKGDTSVLTAMRRKGGAARRKAAAGGQKKAAPQKPPSPVQRIAGKLRSPRG
jgi:methyltransferase family protein